MTKKYEKPEVTANINIEYNAYCKICDFVALGGGDTKDSFANMKKDIEEHYFEAHGVVLKVGERKLNKFESKNDNWLKTSSKIF